ncbi:hypothetical protein [Micromonospora sp. NPDC000442]|uniref:hypothetical protein n=1 Tax=Micromonospora sp. NPDC000442 TaxID=3364217 RepID=UPI003694D353
MLSKLRYCPRRATAIVQVILALHQRLWKLWPKGDWTLSVWPTFVRLLTGFQIISAGHPYERPVIVHLGQSDTVAGPVPRAYYSPGSAD